MSRIGTRIPLVGRTTELGRLRRAWDDARTGSPGAVLVSGDAGIGKTRLVGELAEQAASEAIVLQGHCVGLGQTGPPYLALFETLDQVRQHHPEVLDRFDLLNSMTGASRIHGLDQLQLFDAALSLLTALSDVQPVLWVIEDLHWADASMRDLILFLLARIDSQRLLLVPTYRSDEMHRTHPLRPLLSQLVRMRCVEWVELPPLDDGESRDFVRFLSEATNADDGEPGKVDDALVDLVAARSEGNAFFAEELLDAPDARPSGPLAHVLLSRFEDLSEPARLVARHVAVAGQRTLSHATLALIVAELGADGLDDALRECIDHHVLVPDDRDAYGFRHSLLREAIYTDLLPGQRTRMHGTHAAALAEQSPPGAAGLRAYHARSSNDLPAALGAYVAAAEEAAAVAAPADELAQLESALDLWDAVTDATDVAGVDQYQVVIRAFEAAAATGRNERQLAYGRMAVDLADASGELLRRADSRRRLAKALYAVWELDTDDAGNVQDNAWQLLNEAWELLKDEPASDERAWVLAQLSFGNVDSRDWSDRTKQYAELAIADARIVGNRAAEADAMVCLAFHSQARGDHDGCISLLRQALGIAREANAHSEMLRVWYNLAITQMEAGLLDCAARYIAEGLAYAERVGLIWDTYGRELRSIGVSNDYIRGAWDELDATCAAAQKHRHDWVGAVISSTAALLHAARGQWDEMDAAIESLDIDEASADKPAITAALARAEADLWRGRPAQVVAGITPLIASLVDDEHLFTEMASIRVHTIAITAYADLAARARQRGDDEQLTEAVRNGENHLLKAEFALNHGKTRSDKPGPEARAWFARAHAEASRLRAESDADPWRRVIDAFGYGEIYLQAYARWRLASVLLAAGAHGGGEGGEAALVSALETAVALGASPLREAIHALARRHRIVLPGDRERGDLLTARERSVLELVAQGLTNRAIGTELFISEKTVSVHLSRAMSKLGASSRTEAVSLAIARGVLQA